MSAWRRAVDRFGDAAWERGGYRVVVAGSDSGGRPARWGVQVLVGGRWDDVLSAPGKRLPASWKTFDRCRDAKRFVDLLVLRGGGA